MFLITSLQSERVSQVKKFR